MFSPLLRRLSYPAADNAAVATYCGVPITQQSRCGARRVQVRNGLAIEKFAVTIGRMKKIISTTEAPAAIGPYSQAVRSGSFLFCSGQIPLDPKSGEIVTGNIT